MPSIVEVVVATPDLSTMSRGVKVAGLDSVLSQKGPFTIFAPIDTAFDNLGEGKIDALLNAENKEKLTELMNHHVVEGINNFADLKDKQKLVTNNGRQLNVSVVNGKVAINGSTIIAEERIGSNGVVHSLDRVIEITHL